jgi:DNA (cytosine-5)-methyltransferase 1
MRGSTKQKALAYRLFPIAKWGPGNLFNETDPEDFIVRSEEYGIPQARHRIIILGIRSDVYRSEPKLLQKAARVPIEDVLADLPRLRSGLSKESDTGTEWRAAVQSVYDAGWLKTLNPILQKAIIDTTKDIDPSLSRGASFMTAKVKPQAHKNWYVDKALNGVCNHETRSHIREDLHRYFFASVYAQVTGRSPFLRDFPKELLPDHENVSEAIQSPKFSDRFRVQVCGKPSTTVVSHISKDGHYYIHYDPSQCRSLTVREAARLQTFPDNYYFEGNRTQQYHQVGNAVPPKLALQIADIVCEVLKAIN